MVFIPDELNNLLIESFICFVLVFFLCNIWLSKDLNNINFLSFLVSMKEKDLFIINWSLSTSLNNILLRKKYLSLNYNLIFGKKICTKFF